MTESPTIVMMSWLDLLHARFHFENFTRKFLIRSWLDTKKLNNCRVSSGWHASEKSLLIVAKQKDSSSFVKQHIATQSHVGFILFFILHAHPLQGKNNFCFCRRDWRMKNTRKLWIFHFTKKFNEWSLWMPLQPAVNDCNPPKNSFASIRKML